MKMNSSRILATNIRVRAYHGCLPEEAVIGGDYRVDVDMEVDFSAAAVSDDLSLTVDYCDVQRIVAREMAVRSNLIEQVLRRTGDALLSELPLIRSLRLKITKIRPPMGGDVESVAVESDFSRD
ncbi:MAG: dihydroneopterin aldolase [Bacteroidota bacterium]